MRSPCLPPTVLVVIVLLWNSTLVKTQTANFDLNPVTNFCSRWWSQSIVKDNVLFIDSGLEKWNGSDINPPAYGINNWLLSIPLDTSWDWKTNIVINAAPKNKTNPSTGTYPPSLMRGHMFHGPDNRPELYVFGGTTFMGNQSFQTYAQPDSVTYSLWSYDQTAAGYPWAQYDVSLPWRVNHGAAAEAIDQGLGFLLNGQIDWGTSVDTINEKIGVANYRPLDGMIVLDFHSHSARNISTRGISGNGSRVGGTMEYIPSVGSMGILLALGGQTNSMRPWANSSEGTLVGFDTVDVFDIESYLRDPGSNGTWFQQKTGGDIPPSRIDFCTVSISAPDNSSHHIYLYGGYDPTKAVLPVKDTAYDDVYVLSIPSFTWTPIFTGGQAPRYGHDCHVVSKRQMMTVGGNVTNTGECDWELKSVAFLDMTTVTWGSVFLPNSSAYQVSQKLLPATGGTVDGGATIKEPTNGWTNPGLKTVFDTARTWNLTNSTDPGSSAGKKTNTGAIAGGVIGGVAGLALIAGAIFTWKRRRDKAKRVAELPNDEIGHQELPSERKGYELEGVNENNPAELPAPEAAELNAPQELIEADRDTAATAAELSGTNTVAGGRPGVPVVRTPGDDLPTLPSYTPGLRPRSADRPERILDTTRHRAEDDQLAANLVPSESSQPATKATSSEKAKDTPD